MPPTAKTGVALAGIFVGGASRRFGGRPKGLLRTPSGETIVERWQRMFEALGMAPVLVGAGEAYSSLGLELLSDEPPGVGPLGGLVALLARARGARVIAVACDMPFVSDRLLAKLAHHPSRASAIAAKRGDAWEPFFARFAGSRPEEVARRHVRNEKRSLFAVLDALDAEPLVLSDDELAELRDWDSPADVDRTRTERRGD